MTTPTTIQVKLQIRADTAANWAAVNPVLLANELGLETDTKKFKVGNGSSAWNSLAYFPSIVSGGTVLGNLEIGTTGTLTFEGSTADGFETTLAVVDPTADRTILLPNQSGTVVVGGNASITNADIAANAEIAVSKLADGAARQLLQTDAAGTGVEWTDNVDIPGTLDVTGAATFDAAVTVAGDLTVNGTTTTISTQNLLVEDKNIIIGDVATPTDTTADGGGITLKGATDKTINWVDSTDAWTSSERFSVPLGSASAPSLTFTGDPNTGIYSPGADQVAISTNGTGRLFVDASGRVGVGTGGTQLSTFHVEGTSRFVAANSALFNGSTGTYSTWQHNGTAVGDIGTGNQVFSGGSNTDFAITARSATSLVFGTNTTERMRLDSSGRLGIGTSSPTGLLTVAAASPVIDWTNSSNTAYKHSIESTGYSASAAGNTLAFKVASGSGTQATVMTLDGSGRVGIGTTSPSRLLHLSAADSTSFSSADFDQTYNFLRIVNTTNDKAAGIYFGIGTNGEAAITAAETTDGETALVFGTRGGGARSERARLDHAGRLLVGTSSARSNFYNTTADAGFLLEGTGAQRRAAIVGDDFGSALILALQKSGSAGGNTIVANGDGVGEVSFQGNDGSEFVACAQIKAEIDGTPGANDMPGRLVFSTTADGASSPTERMRISNTGQFFVFSSGEAAFIQSALAAGTTDNLIYGRHSASATTGTGTTSFIVRTNGNVLNTNNSYGAISDIKLKENIVDASSQWSDIKALQVRNYNFKEGQTHTQLGLIAQEVELVSPGLVSESPDRDEEGNDLGTVTKSVNYSVLYMKAVKALQEAMERIEVLEQRLTDAGIA